MPRGSKGKYTEKQKRTAEHIEQSYERGGLSRKTAEARAWATVNKQSGGGERARGAGTRKTAAEKDSARRSSARRAVATRKGIPRSAGASLATQTRTELLKKARSKDIHGRSSMNKQELINALRRT